MGGAHEWARRASVERTRDRGPAAGLRDEIAGEIRELLALQQELYRDDKPIDVSIAAGVVSLTGEVHPQDDAEILPRMARTVPPAVPAHRAAPLVTRTSGSRSGGREHERGDDGGHESELGDD